MAAAPKENVTLLIQASRKGDAEAKNRLFELVYDELRQIAHRSRHVGRKGQTMQPTAVANEAYLLMVKHFPLPPHEERENRETFFRTVALAMRTILRDYWRKEHAKKRGGDEAPIALGELDPPDPGASDESEQLDFLALDEALHRLEKYNRRWCDVVMHRYFAGRSIEETAELMDAGLTTVKTDWQLARAWLRRELRGLGP